MSSINVEITENVIAAEISENIIDVSIVETLITAEIVENAISVSIVENPITVEIIEDAISVSIVETPIEVTIGVGGPALAANVSIADAGDYYTEKEVESALQEIGADISELQDMNSYIIKVDEASATITYLGKAAPGVLDSVASWQINRIDSGTLDAEILFADSDLNFDNIWDNRASLAYG